MIAEFYFPGVRRYMSKKGIRALVYVSLVSVAIWGATGYLVMEAVRAL